MTPQRRPWPAGSLLLLACLVPPAADASGFTPIGPWGGRLEGWAQSRSLPDRMYCLPHRQGVFRSDDRGDTWYRTDLNLGTQAIRGICVSPLDPDHVLAGGLATGEVLRSTDGGVTWSGHPFASGWASVRSLEFSPTEPSVVLASVFGGPDQGVWRSTDAGLTWAASGAGIGSADPYEIAWHPTEPGEVLLANGASVYRSTDGGSNWSAVTETAAGTTTVGYCEADPSRVWAGDWSTGAHRSDDGGLTFLPPLTGVPSGYGFYAGASAAHPTDPDVVAVARIGYGATTPDHTTVESIYLSTDAGGSWTPTSVPPEDDGRSSEYVRKLAFDRAAPQRIYVAVSSGALTRRGWIRSTDGGASWNVAMDAIGGVAVLAVAKGPGGITWVRRAGACGLWKLASGAWTTLGCDRSGRYTVGEFTVHQATGWLHEAGYWTSSDTQDPQYYRSSDQGSSWLQPWIVQSGLFVRPLALATDHGTGARVYAWYQVDWGDAELHRSDNGLDPEMGFQPPLPSFPAAAAVVDPGDDTRLVAVDGDTGEVHLSTDAGVTWVSRSAGLPTAAAIDLFMDPAAPARLAVVYETAGVYRSDDAGVTWAAVPVETGGSEVVDADWDPAGDRIFLATKDLGAWIPGAGLVTAGLPSHRLTSILYEPATGEVLVGTEYASVWRMDPANPTATPVVADAPTGLRLDAHPNPFRGEVRFSLAAPPGVSLDLVIHDVAGRRVATPLVGRSGTAVWDGTDRSGTRVAGGVYFARLRTGDQQVTRRIVLLDR